MSAWKPLPGVVVTGRVEGLHKEILDVDTLKFLATLHRVFNDTRKNLLSRRALQQAVYDNGGLPDFPKETAKIREDPTWQGAPVTPGLEDRRVEITGPVDRKMVINALNSGAYTFMADFEDSNSPSWYNNLNGQVNLRDAVRRTISFKNPGNGKEYKLKDKTATLIIRPRGWHLEEGNVLIDGQPISGSLFDFGIYFFHNARESVKQGTGPYFYLPKMEHYLEARLWNDVFKLSQDYIGIPRGTIRGTVLIETITAAFQMDEIIFELREHSSGLNCGRWDYIFSFIKKTRFNPRFVLPDRNDVTMTVPFLQAYVKLLIQTCHKRGVAAIGGMAAFIPIKNDKAKNDAVIAKVVADKEREVLNGHDGTWVAHPGLVPVALEVFNKHMLGPNQYYVRREDVNVSASDLLNTSVPGKITEAGIRANAQALIEYTGNWVLGLGCVPVNNMMEDAATAEISRAQLWSWVYHKVKTFDGVPITVDLVDSIILDEAKKAEKILPPKAIDLAVGYLKSQIRGSTLNDFLTSDLYDTLLANTVNPPATL